MLSEQAKAEIVKLQAQYPDARSALMPALYVAQREYGWLPDEAIKQVADLFGLTTTEVGSVASFYTMYFREKVGRHVVDFCTDLPCALVGAEEAYKRWRERLGLQDGTTVNVTSERGSLQLGVQQDQSVAPQTCFFPEHFNEPPVKDLMTVQIDATTGVPSFKRARVTIEKA